MAQNAEDFLATIKEILYPEGDTDKEWSSDELPMIAEVIEQFYSTDKPHAEFPCYCEHANHAPDKWCHESSQMGAYSDWVGNVCPACAKGCLPDYIIWPTAVHDGREVFTMKDEAMVALLKATFPNVYFPILPAGEGMYRTLATIEQATQFRNSEGGQ